eukprot:gb/GECG01014367.1/.p1 GENE.gb/GECG01014367.1/~~gb/GECG01014367.1/.p1  ORF type:complete len:484 (+),score=104.97 gb/GECG01014367.1/:1-1452(+)
MSATGKKEEETGGAAAATGGSAAATGNAAQGQDDKTNFQLQSLVLDDVTPATRLLEKRRQMYEVQEALDAQKEEFARREEAFRRREEALRKKDLDLQSTLIHFNKTVTHNEAKRLRAENREAQERKARQELLEKEESLEDELDQEREQANHYEKRIEELRRYSNFMKSVLSHRSDEFADVGSIVQRYFTLKEANNKLQSEQQTLKEETEERRKALNALQSTFESQALASTNNYETLRTDFDRKKQTANEELARQDASKEQQSFKLLEMGQALQSVSHLYNRCAKSQHGPRIRHQPREIEELAQEAELQENEEEAHKKSNENKQFLSQKPKTKGDGRGQEANTVENDILRALQQLEVVGSYIIDFERVVKEYKPSEHRSDSRHSQQRSVQKQPASTGLKLKEQPQEKARPSSRQSSSQENSGSQNHKASKPGLLSTDGGETERTTNNTERSTTNLNDSRRRGGTTHRREIRVNLKSKTDESSGI